MSMELLQDVYNIAAKVTSSSEQAVLAALAFCANHNNGLKCYPKIKTLHRMTHFDERTVERALNGLREKNFIEWETGGWAGDRTPSGMTRSNEYFFNIEEIRRNSVENRALQQSSTTPCHTAPKSSTTNLHVDGTSTTPCHTAVRHLDTTSTTPCHTAVCHHVAPTIKEPNKPMVEPEDSQQVKPRGYAVFAAERSLVVCSAMEVCGYDNGINLGSDRQDLYPFLYAAQKRDLGEVRKIVKGFKAELESRPERPTKEAAACELLKLFDPSGEAVTMFMDQHKELKGS